MVSVGEESIADIAKNPKLGDTVVMIGGKVSYCVCHVFVDLAVRVVREEANRMGFPPRSCRFNVEPDAWVDIVSNSGTAKRAECAECGGECVEGDM